MILIFLLILMYDGDVKELEARQSHWERVINEYRLEIN
jgi:hypothetical protein